MGPSRRTLVLAAACAVVAAAAAVMAVWGDGDGVSEIGQPVPERDATTAVWSIDDLPGDILKPASDASGGGETVQASLEREQQEFVACLARAGFPGYPQRPVFPTLPRTRSEMLERRARQGYGLVDYYNDSLDYDRAVQEYVEALGGRIQEFREAHGNDHEGGPSSGCIASARAAVERSKRYPEFRQGVRAAMPALMSYQTDFVYQSALHRYMACFQESTGLTLQGPSAEGARSCSCGSANFVAGELVMARSEPKSCVWPGWIFNASNSILRVSFGPPVIGHWPRQG